MSWGVNLTFVIATAGAHQSIKDNRERNKRRTDILAIGDVSGRLRVQQDSLEVHIRFDTESFRGCGKSFMLELAKCGWVGGKKKPTRAWNKRVGGVEELSPPWIITCPDGPVVHLKIHAMMLIFY
jgi:hypothetical protein